MESQRFNDASRSETGHNHSRGIVDQLQAVVHSGWGGAVEKI